MAYGPSNVGPRLRRFDDRRFLHAECEMKGNDSGADASDAGQPGKVSTRRIHTGRIITVDHDVIRLPDGSNYDIDVVRHPGGCAGFRVETAFGSVAYLPDHEPISSQGGVNNERREKLVDFVRGVDLLILDTQYTEEEYSRHVGWGHGCLPDSVALAKSAMARRLAFFHHDPSHRDYQIDLMVEAGRKLSASSDLEITAATEITG